MVEAEIPGSAFGAADAAETAAAATTAAPASTARTLRFIVIDPPGCDGPEKLRIADYDVFGSDSIAVLTLDSTSLRRPATPFGSRSMTTITIRPKTTSWPWLEPTSGTLAEISGRRPMNTAPTITPHSEPSPATAAPIRIWSESVTPNSFGWAKPAVARTNSEPATPA